MLFVSHFTMFEPAADNGQFNKALCNERRNELQEKFSNYYKVA